MGSYKPRHLKQDNSLTVRRRGLAVAAAAATVVPLAMSEAANAAPVVATPGKAAVSAAGPIKTAYARTVRYGSRGYYVSQLQSRLNARGYRLAVDGIFGRGTLAALRSFQWRQGLPITGVAWDSTWKRLGGLPGAVSRTATRTSTSGSYIVRYAQQFHGVPYAWGGSTPAGFDCSGLTSYVYRKAAGKILPRTAAQQQRGARRVYSPQPGDLVFSGFPAYHVSIYAGNGYEVHARRPGLPVTTSKIFGYKSYGRY